MTTIRCLSVAVLICTFLVPAPAYGDLPEPPKNHGATQVRVHGTRVEAEAWAVAHGKEVEAVVVTRLVPVAGKPPKVETYERWSVNGRKRFERGSRALGKAWEKHLWALLDEAKAARGKGQKPRDLVDRVLRGLGRGGSVIVGDWIVGWSVGEGTSLGGGRTSVGRTAVFSFTPAPPPATPGPQDPRGDDVTPRDGARPKKKDGEQPVTPRAERGPRPPWPLPRLGRRPGGFSGGAASGSGMGQADSEKGVRQHARVDVDLARVPVPTRRVPAPSPKKPKPVTPKMR